MNFLGRLQVLQGISSSGHWGTRRGLLDSEYAIWMGDLNYRLSMPDEKVTAWNLLDCIAVSRSVTSISWQYQTEWAMLTSFACSWFFGVVALCVARQPRRLPVRSGFSTDALKPC